MRRNKDKEEEEEESLPRRAIKRSVTMKEGDNKFSSIDISYDALESLESCDEAIPEIEEEAKLHERPKPSGKRHQDEDEISRILKDNRITKIYNMDFSNSKLFAEKTQEIRAENSRELRTVLVSCRFFLQFSKYERIDENLSLIASDLVEHRHLQHLHINITYLVHKEEIFFCLPDDFSFAIRSLKHLKSLELISRFSFNTPAFFRNLSNTLRSLGKLESLELHFYNDLGVNDNSFDQLSEGLAYLSRLRVLRLIFDRCDIGDASMEKFLTLFPFLSALSSVFISLNENKSITDRSVKILANKIENNFKKNLKDFELNVEKTLVRFAGLSFLLGVLFDCPDLATLRIHADWSEIDPQIGDYFIKAGKLKNLRSLSFGCCWRNKDFSPTVSLLNNFKSIESLQELSLDVYECSSFLELNWIKKFVSNSVCSVFSQINRSISARSTEGALIEKEPKPTNISDALAVLRGIRSLSLNFEISNNEFSCARILESIEKMSKLQNLSLRILCKEVEFSQWELFFSQVRKFTQLSSLELALSMPVLRKEEFSCLVSCLGNLRDLKGLKIIIFLEYHSRIDMDDWEQFIVNLACLQKLTQLHLSLRNFSLLTIENPNVFFEFSSQLIKRVFYMLRFLTDMKYFGPLPEIMTLNQLPEFFLLKIIVDTQIALAQRLVKARMLLVTLARTFNRGTSRLAVRGAVKSEIFNDFILPEVLEKTTNYFYNPSLPDQRIIVQNNL